jgi:putative multiple sugar transport system substrate-binding protein
MPEADAMTDNGMKEVGIYALPPLAVTKDNIKEAFANDPGRLELFSFEE